MWESNKGGKVESLKSNTQLNRRHKRRERNKEEMGKQKINSKMTDLNPTILLKIVRNVNDLHSN